MKTTLLLTVLLLTTNTFFAQKPEGSFIIRAAQYGESIKTTEDLAKEKSIKVLKDGYWMAIFYKEPGKAFVGSGGGTFAIQNGKYVEKVHFFSWDNTAVDSIYTFTYQLNADRYRQEGKINSKDYSNYLIKEEYDRIKPQAPLLNHALEGVWEIQEGTWASGRLGEGPYAGMTGIKIYAYPTIVFGYHKPGTKEFVAAGGGTYQFDGETLTENLEFHSLENNLVPRTIMYKVQVDDRSTYRQWTADGNTKETWKRISNQ